MHIGRAIKKNPIEAILMGFTVFMFVLTIHLALKRDANTDCPIDAVPIQDKSN